MGRAVLKAGDVVLPAPVSIKVGDEIIWDSKTGRTLDGTMVGDVVAEKKTVSIQWGLLPAEDMKLIADNIVAGFLPVTFYDLGEELTISIYRSTLERDAIGWLSDGVFWYRSANVELVQQ